MEHAVEGKQVGIVRGYVMQWKERYNEVKGKNNVNVIGGKS